MNEATRLANLALETRGYLVIAYRPWDDVPKIGDVVQTADSGEIRGPMKVIAKTNQFDFASQLCLMGPDRPENPEGFEPGTEYFRLVAE